MAIHEEVVREGQQGIKKQFEMSAASMLFDNLQKNQYQYPEKSTIRELGSNASDAINEKLIALKILKGEARPEDFYVPKEGELFDDSKYLPEYYDAKWLSPLLNRIEIVYEEANANTQRDTLRIIDHGVGIGHVVNPVTMQSRLQGCLKLGYSTKRASNVAMGKFGIGAKSALSTGVDSYTMVTRHNGKEHRFEIYDYKADPLVPRLNMVTGEENPFEILEDWEKYLDGDQLEHWRKISEHKVYYLPTDLPNGTEIIVSTKKHHRGTFMNAVKSQLLYFDNVDFTVVHDDGEREEVDFRADIIFENELFILSKNDQMGKPHFLVNKVNYGYVNWQELELEDKIGNIAYKVQPDKVSINPSRESFIWDDKTRATALFMNEQVKELAQKLVQEELVETDLLRWVRKCTQALGESRSKETVVGILSDMIDKKDIKPVFQPCPEIKFSLDPIQFFKGYEAIDVTRKPSNKRDGTVGETISKIRAKNWSSINRPIYLQKGKTSNRTDTYLLTIHPEGFLRLKSQNIDDFREADDMTQSEIDDFNKLKNDESYFKKWEGIKALFSMYLQKSEGIKFYEEVEVPGHIKEPKVDESGARLEIAKMTPADLRKIEGRTIYMYPNFNYGNIFWHKSEPIIKEIMLHEADIVYGFQEDEDLIRVLANMLFRGSGDKYEDAYFDGPKFKLIRISQAAAKHFRNHIYIKDFVADINNKSIGMHSKLVEWHTGRLIQEALPRLRFLENFNRFNPEIQRIYTTLKEYKEKNYRSTASSMEPELNEYANKVIDLQLYIEKHKDQPEAIAAQARALFETPPGEETFTAAVGVNMEIYKELEIVMEYIEPLEHIFNYIGPLLDRGAHISDQLESEIREIMRTKNISK